MNAATQPALSAIGAALYGGIFAGITLDGDQRAALILLPGDEEMPWAKAKTWAQGQGGVLPSRIDMLVLLKNQREEFHSDWYWTSEEHASHADYAWLQDFSGGNQSYAHESDDYRCRAVRRVPI